MKIKHILYKIIPKIDILPRCYRITWLDYEWLIER